MARARTRLLRPLVIFALILGAAAVVRWTGRPRPVTVVLAATPTADRAALALLAEELPAWRGYRVRRAADVAVPAEAWLPGGRQVDATRLLAELDRVPLAPGEVLLVVCGEDGAQPGFTFVFGLAEVGGRHAAIFLPRLRGEPESWRHRVLATAHHELGHTLGLEHCPDPRCVMHFSPTVAVTDAKGEGFCPRCRRLLTGH